MGRCSLRDFAPYISIYIISSQQVQILTSNQIFLKAEKYLIYFDWAAYFNTPYVV
jgi:hypothetical protein